MPSEDRVMTRIPPEGARHRIYRYSLGSKAFHRAFAVEMPVGAQVIAVGHKPGGPSIWATVCVEPEWPTETRFFTVLPTGRDLPFPIGRLISLGSFWTDDRAETWHVFELADSIEDLEDPIASMVEEGEPVHVG